MLSDLNLLMNHKVGANKLDAFKRAVKKFMYGESCSWRATLDLQEKPRVGQPTSSMLLVIILLYVPKLLCLLT